MHSYRKTCVAYDTFTEKSKYMFPSYLLRPDVICRNGKNGNICESDREIVGPIKAKRQAGDTEASKTQPVYYFTNRQPLQTERYEFHKSLYTDRMQNDQSYVYMLFDLTNAPISQLSEFIQQDKYF